MSLKVTVVGTDYKTTILGLVGSVGGILAIIGTALVARYPSTSQILIALGLGLKTVGDASAHVAAKDRE